MGIAGQFEPRPYQAARKALGVTQRQVAFALGCTVNQLKRIERGSVPYPSPYRRLYDLFLGFDSVELLRDDAYSCA